MDKEVVLRGDVFLRKPGITCGGPKSALRTAGKTDIDDRRKLLQRRLREMKAGKLGHGPTNEPTRAVHNFSVAESANAKSAHSLAVA